MDGTRGMSESAPTLSDLAETSARIGADPLRVQAAGGNTSIKRDGVMWIKASGQWLADARTKPIFVKVDVHALRRAFAAGEDVEQAIRFAIGDAGLRPSIETAMHGLIDRAVVLHVHCVATIATAIRRDAESRLAEALAGLDFAFVPYVRPGQPLAEAIAACGDHDIYILGNHGLTVAAGTLEAAADLLDVVAERLHAASRQAPAPDLARLEALAAETGFAPAQDAAVHGLATDPVSLAVARHDSLYPDHVIFLGRGMAEWPAASAPAALVPGAGVLVRADAGPPARAMLRCLADVASRIPEDAPLVTLTEADESALLGWEAEAYRQTLQR